MKRLVLIVTCTISRQDKKHNINVDFGNNKIFCYFFTARIVQLTLPVIPEAVNLNRHGLRKKNSSYPPRVFFFFSFGHPGVHGARVSKPQTAETYVGSTRTCLCFTEQLAAYRDPFPSNKFVFVPDL